MTRKLILSTTSISALVLGMMLAPDAQAATVEQVAGDNGIVNVDHIEVGQVLHVDGADYVVARGDTLGDIINRQQIPANSAPSPLPPPGAPAETSVDSAGQDVAVKPPAVTHHSLNWDAVARCESGNNWSINTGNGFHGGLQFALGTWRSHGGSGMPEHASREEQIRVAENVLATQGRGAWPVCGRRG